MFRDRVDAATQLAAQLRTLSSPDVVVLGLPRGGVPVAAVIAEELNAPLDVIVVRKLGVPFEPEVAMGAVGEAGTRVLDDQLLQQLALTPHQLETVEARERSVLEHRLALLRRGRDPQPLTGRTALIVDDGLATGATAETACRIARARGAQHVILAVPVGPSTAAQRVPSADEVYCLTKPESFSSVGQSYDDFIPTSDDEVILLLSDARRRIHGAAWRATTRMTSFEGIIRTGAIAVPAILTRPPAPLGSIVFAHGSGSSRHSPRNRVVADSLNRAGFVTVLLDLLTPDEEADRTNVFNIPLLGSRLLAATSWLGSQSAIGELPVGYFGASTGAAAALWAAAEPDANARAVVSRGGRPDLAAERLHQIDCPVLLIVGGSDPTTLDLNRIAQRHLGIGTELLVVPGASHLFEEPGTLAEVAAAARSWFLQHVTGTGARTQNGADNA